jgi:glucosamine--fructose-6-phosphate aminotransferase (isomerizing)
MCSIFGIITKQKTTTPIESTLIALKMLEYRGYDSAGIASKEDKLLKIWKTRNKDNYAEGVDELRRQMVEVDALNLLTQIVIGHTRWATHGEISQKNAHPHISQDGNFAIAHNGIIENYIELKEFLRNKGYYSVTDTDTEVLANLIEYRWNETGRSSFEEAVRQALSEIDGAFAVAVITSNENKMIVASRSGGLFVGITTLGFVVASDQSAIISHTKDCFEVESDCLVVLTPEKYEKRTIASNQKVVPDMKKIELEISQIQKNEYDHFMQKEIFEQPKTLTDALRGRVRATEGIIKLRGIEEHLNKIVHAKRIIILGCGTSWHAGLVAEYLFEEFARIPTEVEYASEFINRNPIIREGDIVIAISQSGETADTLAALEVAKKKGATVIGLCNVVSSKIARMAGVGVYLHIGPEISVASTKAFTGQVAVLTAIALLVGRQKGALSESAYMLHVTELAELPQIIEKYLPYFDERARSIVYTQLNSENALYLGRGYNFPVALEGALKLKEVSYIHAEGYPAAEMKHGPIALIDEKMPVIVIAPQGDETYKKILGNIQEVKARKGKVIVIATEGDREIHSMADEVICIPRIANHLVPIIAVIPLQLIAYHCAVMKGLDVDRPRHLAKSVTVQ